MGESENGKEWKEGNVQICKRANVQMIEEGKEGKNGRLEGLEQGLTDCFESRSIGNERI
jgi:hypothetical protein